MPITPLHLGILAPLNHFLPGKVSNLSFILVTLWLDAAAIAYYAFGLDIGEFHEANSHSFIAAFAIAGIVTCVGLLCMMWKAALQSRTTLATGHPWAWVVGAYLGGLIHILLDAMVHSEMFPFHPLAGNPFYWGGMGEISLVLVLPFIWLIFQYVLAVVGLARKSRVVERLLKRQP